MNPKQIKEALHGGIANKKLGQHFLIDNAALEDIVSSAEIKKGDRVLEVGPGLGVLTTALIEKGAKVVAIEKDRRFIERLADTDVEVHSGDAAKMDWAQLVGDKPWKFVSNLPYSITSLALRKALYGKSVPEVLVVLVQREVAERVLARDGKQSLLSLMVALASSASEIVRRVPPGAFYPPPKVESAILMVRPMTIDERMNKWQMDPEDVMMIAKKGFAHPRKILRGNLGIDEISWASMSDEIGCVPKTRAEDLSPQQWVNLSKLMKTKSPQSF